MGRENIDDSTVIHSSIALLQERFRQLQRVKEMREEREFVRLVSESKQLNFITMMHYEPSRYNCKFHHELMPFPQQRSPPQVSLSLWPTLQCKSKNADYYGGMEMEMEMEMAETPPSMKLLWPTPTFTNYTTSDEASLSKFDDHEFDSDSDVDTSLHL